MGMGVLALVDVFDDEKQSDLSRVAVLVGEQVSRTAKESIERIKARNAKENQEKPCAVCSAPKCYKSCPRWQIYADPDETFKLLAKYSRTDMRVKEVMPPGVPTFKSSSRSKRKRKDQFKALRVSVWEGI